MANTFYATHSRFQASGGKLDSINRYLFLGGGGLNWPSLNSHTVWTSSQFGYTGTFPGLAFEEQQVTAVWAGNAPYGNGRLNMSI